ncbi:MAG: rod shape-determining protein MreD [Thiotrichaceae bacterium]|nr:rod shape-determining protein MreD [Thiotrichaceae bacterium]
MENLTLRFTGAILLTYFIAIVLSISHLPTALQAWRPEWVALVMIHWAIFFPKKTRYWHAMVVGLFLDSLLGSVLGQHALGLLIVQFSAIRLTERILPKTLLQHLFIVALTVSYYLLINLWVRSLTQDNPTDWSYWFTLLSSLIIWPILHALMKNLQVKRREL